MKASLVIAGAIFFVEFAAAGPLRWIPRGNRSPDDTRVPYSITPVDESTNPPAQPTTTFETNGTTTSNIGGPFPIPTASSLDSTITTSQTTPSSPPTTTPPAADTHTQITVHVSFTLPVASSTEVTTDSNGHSSPVPTTQETSIQGTTTQETSTQGTTIQNTTTSQGTSTPPHTPTLPTPILPTSTVLTDTTKTFPTQRYTASNTLTGFSEIQPVPQITPTLPPVPFLSITNVVEPTKTPTTTLTTTTSSSTENNSVPVFSVTNTNSLPPAPTNTPIFTLTNTDIIPPPNPTAVITIDISSLTAHRPTTTTLLITKVPTVVPVADPSPTPITPEQYQSSLAEAIGYNALFSSLTATSPCEAGQIACIAGQVGNCNAKGSFTLETCSRGSACFALPMNSSTGVYVGCRDKVDAEFVLKGSGSAPPTTTTSVAVPTPTPSPEQPTPHPKPTESANDPITVTTNVPGPTPTVYVTLSKPNAAPVQTPSPNAPLPKPPALTGTAGGVPYTIVPVPETTAAPAVPEREKETVTVTVTKTERV